MRKKASSNYINEEKINASCGMAYALALMGGRWKPAILWLLLANGKLRYSQIRKNLSHISERVLVSQLRELEQDLLVSRVVHAEVPHRVEYELTALGASMENMLDTISQWGEMHRKVSSDQA
jgi:DNA-binding HxlR family transcriptional regulator